MTNTAVLINKKGLASLKDEHLTVRIFGAESDWIEDVEMESSTLFHLLFICTKHKAKKLYVESLSKVDVEFAKSYHLNILVKDDLLHDEFYQTHVQSNIYSYT